MYILFIVIAPLAGTQLIRRNDELALLYEKIKLQQSALARGQLQYRDRLNEVRVLKIKVGDLQRELHIVKSSVSNVGVLKREVHSLGKQLLQERTKVKALSEELENPLNVHRCAAESTAVVPCLKVRVVQVLRAMVIRTDVSCIARLSIFRPKAPVPKAAWTCCAAR